MDSYGLIEPVGIALTNEEIIILTENFAKDYMKKYGIQNVRGGSYTQIELSPEITDIIQKEFNGNADKCYKCQKYGHFANKCTEESEEKLITKYGYALGFKENEIETYEARIVMLLKEGLNRSDILEQLK